MMKRNKIVRKILGGLKTFITARIILYIKIYKWAAIIAPIWLYGYGVTYIYIYDNGRILGFSECIELYFKAFETIFFMSVDLAHQPNDYLLKQIVIILIAISWTRLCYRIYKCIRDYEVND